MEAHSGEIKLINKHVSGDNGKRGYVERELYADGELIYKDRMSNTMFCFTVRHPDLLMTLMLFCSGECGLNTRGHPPKVEFEINPNALIRKKPTLWHRIIRYIRNYCKRLKSLAILRKQ